jgi:hypothetical protein
MKNFLLALFALAGFSAVAQKTVYDANAEVRSVSGFKGIKVSQAITLYLSQGTDEAVAVSAEKEETKKKIVTEVKNGILHISLGDKKFFGVSFRDEKIKAYVTVKDISSLEASGACNVRIDGTLKSDQLKVELSGASDLRGAIQVKSLDLEASGAARIRLTGHADKADLELSGASDFKEFEFTADQCKLHVSGAGRIEITVTKELEAEASGGSVVRYKGDPSTKKLETSGGASIKKKA